MEKRLHGLVCLGEGFSDFIDMNEERGAKRGG